MYQNCKNCRYFDGKLIKCLQKNKMLSDRYCQRYCKDFKEYIGNRD